MNEKELFQKRGELYAQMRAVLDKAGAEKRNLTDEETQTYDRIESDFDKVSADLDRVRKANSIEVSLRSDRDGHYAANVRNIDEKGEEGSPVRQRKGNGPAYRKAFDAYARTGKNGLNPNHFAALQEGTDSEGGYLVPEEFETKIYEILHATDPVRANANVIRTGSDRNIPIEVSEGTFAYIAEEGAYGESDPAFGRVVISAYKSGGIIKVSEELLQDGFFNLQAYLSGLAARRFAAIQETAWATGNGTSAPHGLFVTTSVGGVNLPGITGAVSATAAITGDDLIDVFHSLPRAYRQNAKWIMSDAMVKLVRKVKDQNDQYLWQPGLQAGQQDILLGKPVLVSEGATAPAPTAKSIVFGDLSFYTIVDRLGIVMQRLNELYAANGQVGFKFMARNDADLVDPRAFTSFTHGAAA